MAGSTASVEESAAHPQQGQAVIAGTANSPASGVPVLLSFAGAWFIGCLLLALIAWKNSRRTSFEVLALDWALITGEIPADISEEAFLKINAQLLMRKEGATEAKIKEISQRGQKRGPSK